MEPHPLSYDRTFLPEADVHYLNSYPSKLMDATHEYSCSSTQEKTLGWIDAVFFSKNEDPLQNFSMYDWLITDDPRYVKFLVFACDVSLLIS
jgi:hypothetical protein